MPVLRFLRLVSLVIFYPSFGFGVFAMLAQEYSAGSALLAIAAASGVWAIVCAVADRVVTLLEGIERSTTTMAKEASNERKPYQETQPEA